MANLVPLSQMPLTFRHIYILGVSSMEQVIGAALSTIVGVMIPLILLLGTPHLTSVEQGLVGAAGLIGIATGSPIIGRFIDSMGYLVWFRICPLLIIAGSVGVYYSDSFYSLVFFLYLIGFGVGGGYSLDSAYISEIMPEKWKAVLVGVAKASSSLGFIGAAFFGFVMLKLEPNAQIWNFLIFCTGSLGVLTLLLRIKWYESPLWLIQKGKVAQAEQAAKDFLGSQAEIDPALIARKQTQPKETKTSLGWKRIIFSGVPWACEGLGVYGFGVFLPILVMSLGLQSETAEGIPKIISSVESTIYINLFIAAGFIIGLLCVRKVNLVKLMGWGFVICAVSLGVLLLAHTNQWDKAISFVGFIVFETALNAGPHLVTFIVPSKIYSVEERGLGTGVASMVGKIGAVAGVFCMPVLLEWGGVSMVLWVSIAVMLAGALITFGFGKALKLV